MLGLGSNITSISKVGTTIVTDNLVLRHDYKMRAVEPLSSGAAYFNGTSDIISLGTITGTTGHKSMTAWIYHDGSRTLSNSSSNQGAILTFGDVMFELTTATEITAWEDVDSGTGDGPIPTALNNWRHIAVTMEVSGSDTITKVYADGVHIETTTVGGSVPTTDSRGSTIGSYSGGRFFPGYICNVGFWSGTVLTQPQIKSIMNKNYDSLSSSEKTDLVSWWNLDSVIPDTTTLVYDNHHGGEGEVLGVELVNCVGFDCADPAAVWNEGSGWGFSGGKAIYDGTGGTSPIAQSDVIEVGKTYRVSVEVLSNEGSGSNTLFLGGTILSTGNLSVGTHVFYGATNNSSVALTIHGRSGEVFEIGSFSAKEINGNTGTLS